ncbi:uncharacterized protein LOC120288335 [Eucalyptus grandis]|uniref:uncharacterized protein LOC120288335 n=1 Tax=Eucalyptus grandis TaxID=71139 RepID=UPI00192ED0A3|nr:uncharacterized protein LOC120288335 [Eucalyptus grandis]
MAERKQRDVEELYCATDLIQQPEITPVLKGRCRMQGPGDEAYSNSKKDSVANQVPSPDVKGFGGPSMSQKKVNITAESGTCNVCSAPCTSCMHLNQVIMGSKRKEYSDETCLDGVASQYSANDYDVLRPLSGASAHSPQGTADETSRPQGFNSGYSCDNTKNKTSFN